MRVVAAALALLVVACGSGGTEVVAGDRPTTIVPVVAPSLFPDGHVGIVIVDADGAGRVVEFDPGTGTELSSTPVSGDLVNGGLGGRMIRQVARTGDSRLSWVVATSTDTCGTSPEGHLSCAVGPPGEAAELWEEGAASPIDVAAKIVLGPADRSLRLEYEGEHSHWELLTDRDVTTLDETSPIDDAQFSPDGSQVALVPEWQYDDSGMERTRVLEVRSVDDPCVRCPTTSTIELPSGAHLVGWLDEHTLVVGEFEFRPESGNTIRVSTVDVASGEFEYLDDPESLDGSLDMATDGAGRVVLIATSGFYPDRAPETPGPSPMGQLWEDGVWRSFVLPPIGPTESLVAVAI